MLPPWATGTTSDWCVGAQCATRDGRRVGNAAIVSFEAPDRWQAITDDGNWLTLNRAELDELFWPPQWVMDPRTAIGLSVRQRLH